MIRVVFFDLGLTLVDARNRPFPHVAEALRTVQQFVTENGKPLLTGLVSDFEMPSPPATPAKIRTIFEKYLAVLDETGLRPLFEPVQRRVTLSTHAGVSKPDRRIFTTALARLRSTAGLDECLLITENAGHIEAARTRLHMSTLRFRSGASPQFDFDDWTQAPAMVARLIDPAGAANAETVLRRHLSVAHGFEVNAVEPSTTGPGTTTVRGTLWRPLGASAPGGLEDVHVPFTVEGRVTRGSAGEIRAVQIAEPSGDQAAEAASFLRSLARHGQVGGSTGPLGDTSTHDIETDAQGRRRLVRKRFRAL